MVPGGPLTGPVRVAQVITRLNVGGPALLVLLLAERLDPERFAPVVIHGTTLASEGDMRQVRPTRAATLHLPTLAREISPVADLRTLASLVRELRRLRPAIVHTHLAKAGLLGRIAARLTGVPVVVHTFHGTVFEEYFDPVRSRLFLALERWAARLSDRLVALSASQREQLLRRGVGRSTTVVEIPIGVELERFRAPARGALRAELGVAEGAPLVGSVGRLVPIKAVDAFLDAAARVARSCPDARFVVVGGGELEQDLRRRAGDLGLDARLDFLGFRADLEFVLADLDVLVLSSRNEGTPVTVIEALAAGCAVVATAVGGVPEVLEHGRSGVLVPPGDTVALAAAVERLIDDPAARSRLGSAGRARAWTSFEAGAMVARVAALYEDLLREKRVGTGRPAGYH